MTQEQIDVLYELTIIIHDDEWFGVRNNPRDRNDVQEWVAKKLSECMKIYTIPCGMSWGTLVTKEQFDTYWSMYSKVDI